MREPAPAGPARPPSGAAPQNRRTATTSGHVFTEPFLLAAVRGGTPSEISGYLDSGAAVGEDAVEAAIDAGRTSALGILLNSGAPAGPSAMELSLRRGEAEPVRLLLRHGIRFGEAGADGALATAAGQASKELVELLIGEGADPGADYPLLHAVLTGTSSAKEEVVKLLVEGGADVNGLDKEGKPSLWHAVTRGEAEAVKALLEAGADAGFTSFDEERGRYLSLPELAAELGNGDVGNLLREAVRR